MKNKQFTLLALALLSTLNSQLSTWAQGTAFTYQGRLTSGTNLANGSYDLTFTLFGADIGGSAVAGPITNSPTAVNNGLFVVALDFGANFPGADRWLEIAVRTNGGGAFTTLSPRQIITPTPYAITAGNLTGTLPASQLSGTLPSAALGGTYAGTVTLDNPANRFTGNGAGLSNAFAIAAGDSSVTLVTNMAGRLVTITSPGGGGTTYASNIIGGATGGQLPDDTVTANNMSNGYPIVSDGTSRYYSNRVSLATIDATGTGSGDEFGNQFGNTNLTVIGSFATTGCISNGSGFYMSPVSHYFRSQAGDPVFHAVWYNWTQTAIECGAIRMGPAAKNLFYSLESGPGGFEIREVWGRGLTNICASNGTFAGFLQATNTLYAGATQTNFASDAGSCFNGVGLTGGVVTANSYVGLPAIPDTNGFMKLADVTAQVQAGTNNYAPAATNIASAQATAATNNYAPTVTNIVNAIAGGVAVNQFTTNVGGADVLGNVSFNGTLTAKQLNTPNFIANTLTVSNIVGNGSGLTNVGVVGHVRVAWANSASLNTTNWPIIGLLGSAPPGFYQANIIIYCTNFTTEGSANIEAQVRFPYLGNNYGDGSGALIHPVDNQAYGNMVSFGRVDVGDIYCEVKTSDSELTLDAAGEAEFILSRIGP